MFLKRLAIHNGDNLIRSIPFHDGINLIVDETNTDNPRESGNNVGKTTVLRLIDYCLGGDGKNIYKDPEFKDKANTQVEDFLKQNNIIVSLLLKKELHDATSQEILIKRNFLQRRHKIFEINGKKQTVKDFPVTLKRLVFGSEEEKPKFRQIIAKNIRDERNRLTNTVKVLSPYTTIEEYEAVFLFWLGIEGGVNARKQELLRNKKTEEAFLRKMAKSKSLSEIEQSLLVVDRTIEELTAERDSFDVSENYAVEVERLDEVKAKINAAVAEIGCLELRQELIVESEAELRGEVSTVDRRQISDLYEQANVLIPNLQKTFEETIDFHNEMIQMRRDFITKELPEIRSSLSEKKRNLSSLLLQEASLAKVLRKSGVVEKLQEVMKELGEVHETRGTLLQQEKMWVKSMANLKDAMSELESIDKGIFSKDALIKKRIAHFNKYFSKISAKLYGERFVLSSDKHERGYELKIGSLAGNLGTGKKKGQMAAFDLAYVQFADSLGIPCLHFILQDQIENVHDNQINKLLTELVAGVNCQYVLPVLRDKLPPDINARQYEVLSLSQSDKLFGLP